MPSAVPINPYRSPMAAQPTAYKAEAGTAASAPDAAAGEGDKNPLFGKDGFTFGDFLDIINPLQHIPIVSTIYRAVTGDKIDPGASIAGGALFGGPIGMIASVIGGMVEESTGKDPGEHVLAALGIDLGPNPNHDEPQVADAAAAQATQPQAMQQQAQALKLGVTMDQAASTRETARKPADREEKARDDKARDESKSDNANAPIELPTDLFQALKQTAAAQKAADGAAVANAATTQAQNYAPAQERSTAPMQTNAMPNNAIQAADGRNWYPAHPMGGGGGPTRGVGAQQVTQQGVQARYGGARPVHLSAQTATAAAAAAAQMQNGDPQQKEWMSRASDAYQKYFDMQQEKNLRTGITRGGVPAF